MKKRSVLAFIAAAMSAVTLMLPPMQVMAAKTEPVTPTEYISEVRIGVGKTMEEAEKSLEGYTILKNGESNADLNQKAGGGMGSQGERVVLLGYKTTTDKSDAITDLAVMNMKGGYDVKEYEALFDTYIKSQVTPLSQKYITMLKEYRENYNSDNEYNKAKAVYVHDILNKFIDDDTGKGLGDLFLNETKEELGDAYNKLSDSQKKEHADLITIISQSNGNATLLMQSLLARACDTDEEPFTDRFAALTYDELVKSSGLTPTDAKDELAKLYDDGANMLLETWDSLKDSLDSYDDAVDTVENYDEKACTQAIEAFGKLDDNSSEEEIEEVTKAYKKALDNITAVISAGQVIAIHDKLADIEYEDGTLLDFFTQDYDDISDNIEALYPLVASLSEGQSVGIEFVSLRELLLMVLTDDEGYKTVEFDNLSETSIYEGVDRAIYQMGGVALTTAARRNGVMEDAIGGSKYEFSTWSYIGGVVAAVCAAGAIGSGILLGAATNTVKIAKNNYDEALNALEYHLASEGRDVNISNYSDEIISSYIGTGYKADIVAAQRTANIIKGLTIGFSVAFIIISAVTIYFTYTDMQEFYHVDFTPIPHYMVDEKDIIAYNAKGEKVVLKNQSAYYKAVECNRTSGDEKYKNIGTCADMNGDVGKQWLALYAVKNEAMAPIIADSLLVKVNSTDLPSGYTTGIHMFGSDSAFNLNNTKYVWNGSAPNVFVYFNVDDQPSSTSTGASAGTNTDSASVTGSVFTTGSLFLSGGIGLLLGAGIVALIFIAMKPKKKNEE